MNLYITLNICLLRWNGVHVLTAWSTRHLQVGTNVRDSPIIRILTFIIKYRKSNTIIYFLKIFKTMLKSNLRALLDAKFKY